MKGLKIKVANGKVSWEGTPALSAYSRLSEGTYYLVPVKEEDIRSTAQNALLWERYQQIADFINTHEWWIQDGELVFATAKMIHDISKSALREYLPKTSIFVIDDSGAGLHYGEGTTTKLSRTDKGRQAFEKYYDAVGQLWAENYPDLEL